jgi:hypothetical protein
MSETDPRLRLRYNRVHAVATELRHRAEAATAKARAQADQDSPFAASLRGKAKGYSEAAQLVDALEQNRPLWKRRRFWVRTPNPSPTPKEEGKP